MLIVVAESIEQDIVRVVVEIVWELHEKAWDPDGVKSNVHIVI